MSIFTLFVELFNAWWKWTDDLFDSIRDALNEFVGN